MIQHEFPTVRPANKLPEMLSGRPFYVGESAVDLSRSTKRILRKRYAVWKAMDRVESQAKHRAAKLANEEVRATVKTLQAARRVPATRIRSRNSIGYEYQPLMRIENLRPDGTVLSTGYSPSVTVRIGENKVIQDIHPVYNRFPRLNPVTVKSEREYAFKTSLICKKGYPYPNSIWENTRIAGAGLSLYSLTGKVSAEVGFDRGLANRALQAAYARVNQAEFDGNEYIVEFKQVLRLLKDPFRTMASFHKTMERWLSADSWVFVPAKICRQQKVNTMLVHGAFELGMLLSFRTRRKRSVVGMSPAILREAANRWLQYRYGIAPMALDIGKLISIYTTQRHVSPLRVAYGRHVVSRGETSTRASLRIFAACTPLYNVSKKWGEFYAAKVYYEMVKDVPLSAQVNLHPSQVARVVWNALPYSFVVDWALNIDRWLLAGQNPPWIRVVGNCCSHKIYEEIRSEIINFKDMFGHIGHASGGLAVRKFEAMRREVNLPRENDLMLSSAWTSIKNLGTALALIINKIK